MPIAVADLVKDLTLDDVLDDELEIAAALGLPTTAWQSGEPILSVLSIVADQIAKLWNRVLVKAIRAVFLDHAEGDWLTLFAGTFWETWRNEATFATGPVTLENRGNGFYQFQPGQVRLKNANGKTFINVGQSPGPLVPWPGGNNPYPTVTLTFQAEEAGAASSTPIGGIAGYPTVPLSAPTHVYALPNGAALLGQDREDDEALKARAKRRPAEDAVAAPRSKYESFVLGTKRSDGTSVNINRVRVVDGGGGTVHAYLASPSGPASGDVNTPDSDVYLVHVRLQLFVVPVGLAALSTASAVAKTITATVTLYVNRDANVTQTEAESAAGAALARFFAKLPIGGAKKVPGGPGFVLKEKLEATASESMAGAILGATSTLTGDVQLLVNEVAVPNITVQAVLVTQV